MKWTEHAFNPLLLLEQETKWTRCGTKRLLCYRICLMVAPTLHQSRDQRSCNSLKSWTYVSNRLTRQPGKPMLQANDTHILWNCCHKHLYMTAQKCSWAANWEQGSHLHGKHIPFNLQMIRAGCTIWATRSEVICFKISRECLYIQNLLLSRHLHASYVNARQMLFFKCANISLAILLWHLLLTCFIWVKDSWDGLPTAFVSYGEDKGYDATWLKGTMLVS